MLYQNPLSCRVYVVAPGHKNGNDLRETAFIGINSIRTTFDAIRNTEIIYPFNNSPFAKFYAYSKNDVVDNRTGLSVKNLIDS